LGSHSYNICCLTVMEFEPIMTVVGASSLLIPHDHRHKLLSLDTYMYPQSSIPAALPLLMHLPIIHPDNPPSVSIHIHLKSVSPNPTPIYTRKPSFSSLCSLIHRKLPQPSAPWNDKRMPLCQECNCYHKSAKVFLQKEEDWGYVPHMI
jgi:hypothetical protein